MHVKEDVQSSKEKGSWVTPSLGNRIIKYLTNSRELSNIEDAN